MQQNKKGEFITFRDEIEKSATAISKGSGTAAKICTEKAVAEQKGIWVAGMAVDTDVRTDIQLCNRVEAVIISGVFEYLCIWRNDKEEEVPLWIN